MTRSLSIGIAAICRHVSHVFLNPASPDARHRIERRSRCSVEAILHPGKMMRDA